MTVFNAIRSIPGEGPAAAAAGGEEGGCRTSPVRGHPTVHDIDSRPPSLPPPPVNCCDARRWRNLQMRPARLLANARSRTGLRAVGIGRVARPSRRRLRAAMRPSFGPSISTSDLYLRRSVGRPRVVVVDRANEIYITSPCTHARTHGPLRSDTGRCGGGSGSIAATVENC